MNRSPPSGDDDPPPTAPMLPDDEACCGQGCDPCVFDVYAAAQERYLADLRVWQERQLKRAPGAGRASRGRARGNR